MKECKCRACGAPIVWITTTAGKMMPCDASPVEFWRRDKGNNERVVTPQGAVVSCTYEREPGKPSYAGFKPHWGSCKAPESFKRRGIRK